MKTSPTNRPARCPRCNERLPAPESGLAHRCPRPPYPKRRHPNTRPPGRR